MYSVWRSTRHKSRRLKGGEMSGSTYWNDFIEAYKYRLADLTLRQILEVYSAWFVDEKYRADKIMTKYLRQNRRE